MSVTTIERATDLRDLDDGCEVDQVLLVRDVQRCTTRKGSDYLRLVVGDRSASLPAVMWECSDAVLSGPVLRVVGRVSDHHRYGRQVIVAELHETEPAEIDLESLASGPSEASAELERRLDAIIESVSDRWLCELLQRLLGRGGALRERFLGAPAAKYNHHAYRAGLLEHTLQVADAVGAVATLHAVIDRDLAVAGAVLHDIGKLDSYDDDPLGFDFTEAGRLEGEIPMGYYRVRRAIEDVPGFPEGRARALLHIILSHHGMLEHGSPVVPATREAAVVHRMDELSAQLGAFERLERETPDGEAWSRYDRVLGSSACLAARNPGVSRVHDALSR